MFCLLSSLLAKNIFFSPSRHFLLPLSSSYLRLVLPLPRVVVFLFLRRPLCFQVVPWVHLLSVSKSFKVFLMTLERFERSNDRNEKFRRKEMGGGEYGHFNNRLSNSTLCLGVFLCFILSSQLRWMCIDTWILYKSFGISSSHVLVLLQ